jgi:bacillithiol biosynthesis deacetylase BshB1
VEHLTEPLDVLVVAPHPDDAELGAGGTILKMLASGWRVGVLDLTTGEPTPHGSLELRAAETDRATEILGLSWRHNLGLMNRFLEPSLGARRKLAEVFRLTRPRWIMAPYWEDAHPDHVAATQLIEDARFWAKLSKTDMRGEPFHPERVFYYYCVHLKLVPQPAFVVDISDFCERKLEAIDCYQSQFVTGREQVQPGLIERLREEAGFWGRAIGVRFGEPIASREPLGLRDFKALV